MSNSKTFIRPSLFSILQNHLFSEYFYPMLLHTLAKAKTSGLERRGGLPEPGDVVLPNEVWKNLIKVSHGTTTLAFIIKEGIVVAVDSKATAGAYVSSLSVNKVIEINPYLLGTMAGGAADCFFWQKRLGVYAKRYELENDERLSAQEASKYLSDIMYHYKGQGISMSSMICGYDTDGPSIYNVTDTGSCLKHYIFSVGSGSTVAKSILSQEYSPDMPKDAALSLAQRAIYCAGRRDAASGGSVNVYFMNEAGWEKVGQWSYDELAEQIEIEQ